MCVYLHLRNHRRFLVLALVLTLTLGLISWTTGDPKAVMITHDNILFEAKNAIEAIDESRGGITAAPNGDRILSYLPLSHVAGMMVDIICAQVVVNRA